MPNYSKLYTPQDSAVVFIDHQPQMTFGVANIDRALLMNNVTLLAKVASEFKVPAVVTAVETESFSGYVWPQLLDVFPGQLVVERSSMNAWDGAGGRSPTHDYRCPTGMAARLGQARALRRSNESTQAARRRVWQRSRIRLYHGPQGAAVGEGPTDRCQENVDNA